MGHGDKSDGTKTVQELEARIKKLEGIMTHNTKLSPLEKTLAQSLMNCLLQGCGYYDEKSKHNYVCAFGHFLSTYEETIDILDDLGLLDPSRIREEHGNVRRLRWEKVE